VVPVLAKSRLWPCIGQPGWLASGLRDAVSLAGVAVTPSRATFATDIRSNLTRSAAPRPCSGIEVIHLDGWVMTSSRTRACKVRVFDDQARDSCLDAWPWMSPTPPSA